MTKVADQILAQYIKFQHDMLERVLKGSIDPIELMNVQRPLIGQKVSVEEKIFNKSSFFTEGNNGVTKLWFSDNFKNFLELSPENHLTTVDLPSYQTVSKSMNDFDIRKHYGEDIIKTPAQILKEMHAVISSDSKTLADEYSNIWYYLDESGELRCVGCYWDTDNAVWDCRESAADTNTWDAGIRIFGNEA